jgi:hypothetical protein
VTTAVMRKPSRPPVVGQAAAVLWTVAALFAAACAVKAVAMGSLGEVGRDAQFGVANRHNYDPDLLEYVSFYLGVTAFAVILCYASSALWFALAARSVARGRRRSFLGTVLASVNVALGFALQPLVWFRMHETDDAKAQQVMDQMAERMPLWVLAGDALAVIALLAAADTIVKLCSNDAQWFRGARP